MYAFLTKRTSDLRFPPRYCLGSILFGFLRRVFGLFVPMFRRNVLFSSSGLWVNSRPYREDEGGSILRNTGKQLPNHMAQQPEDLLPQYENRFAKNDTSQRYAISSGQSGKLAATLAIYFAAVFLSLCLSLACYASDKVRCYCRRYTYVEMDAVEKLRLSRTHARTHARAVFKGQVLQRILLRRSLLAHELYRLYITQSNHFRRKITGSLFLKRGCRFLRFGGIVALN